MAVFIDQKATVSLERQFVYYRMRKSASSTVLKTLYLKEHGGGLEDYDHGRAIDSYTRLSMLSKEQVYAIEQTYFTFTFVRNPWCSGASADLDKIVKVAGGSKRPKRPQPVYNFLGREPGSRITFREFCDYLQADGLYGNAHWTPQSALVNIPVAQLDFVGKLECLDQDLGLVLSRIFGDAIDTDAISSHRDHQTNANWRLHELYDELTAGMVRTLYVEDFATFGYDPTEPNADAGRKDP